MSSDMQRAIRIARKKIRTLSPKALESNLRMFCGSYAEAFEQGVDEAQQEIVRRLTESASVLGALPKKRLPPNEPEERK